MKKCSHCKIEKPFNEFIKQASKKDGISCYCIECSRIRCKKRYDENKEKDREYKSRYYQKNKEKFHIRGAEWRKNNKDKRREQCKKSSLKRKYNMTIEDYDNLLIKQNNKCAICKKENYQGNKNRFCVDHCHITGKVRGLLCDQCNKVLGLSYDSIEILTNCIEYLTHK